MFFQDLDGINKHLDFPEDEIDQSGDDCIENHINDIIQNNQHLGKKPVENSQSSQITEETLAINEHLDFPGNENDQSGDDCIENHINDIIQNNQPQKATQKAS